MTIDLDKLEALASELRLEANAMTRQPMYFEQQTKYERKHEIASLFDQVVAETRANADQLRVAVEALEQSDNKCENLGSAVKRCGTFGHTCAACVRREALATLSAPTGDHK